MYSNGSGSTVLGIVLVVVYFIPAIVAIVGRHRRWLLITLINLMFGWTVIGWLIALALLATGRRQEPPPLRPLDAGPGGLPAPLPPPPPPPAPAPAAAATESRAEQLEKLAALRDSGALTEEEFAAEKARVLGAP